ncbi:Flp family type IVb pilin [Rhizobium sp. FKY42]|uniref:Flp family type IVb pilin n=1 Tax=Rhizobium sp. FKY42 TaxID=2562310 RepID=UPI001981BB36|nr:Flp family type IVb pilin [Rhizobium sp. FKY42]
MLTESGLYWILRCVRHTEGATAVEYGLIAGIIGGALILGIGAFSDNLSAMFTTISDLIKG